MHHPYVGKPDYQFWKRAPGLEDIDDLDPVVNTSFQISTEEPVVTAGSCFAQHVARYLRRSGFNHFVSEEAHPSIPEDIWKSYGYGIFSARYGNIYTARQLRQLIERSYGIYQPLESVWYDKNGRLVDPFRPKI